MLLILLLFVALPPPSSAAPKPTPVVPGVSVGNLRLGDTRAAIHKLRGKPTRSSKTHRGQDADTWLSPDAQLQVEVVYLSGRAVQIAVSSEEFATAGGLSTASTHARIEKALPAAKETIYFYDTETGKGLEYHDDVAQGLAFVFHSPTKQFSKAGNGMDETPWLLVVHRRGHPGLPTLQGQRIPDLSNSALQGSPTRRDAPSAPKSSKKAPSASGASETGCRNAVQGFYDWYVKLLADDSRETTACMRAVKARPQWFSPELRRALAEDAAAQAKSPGEIVGLNADPFVFASDPAPRYVVRNVTRQGSRYRPEVHAVMEGKVEVRPSVIGELELRGSQWVFVDFTYPPQAAGEKAHRLLELLSSDREHRKKP